MYVCWIVIVIIFYQETKRKPKKRTLHCVLESTCESHFILKVISGWHFLTNVCLEKSTFSYFARKQKFSIAAQLKDKDHQQDLNLFIYLL